MNLKERLKNGERVFGTMVRCQRDPAYCIIAKDAGMDFILFDCEHGIYSPGRRYMICFKWPMRWG